MASNHEICGRISSNLKDLYQEQADLQKEAALLQFAIEHDEQVIAELSEELEKASRLDLAEAAATAAKQAHRRYGRGGSRLGELSAFLPELGQAIAEEVGEYLFKTKELTERIEGQKEGLERHRAQLQSVEHQLVAKEQLVRQSIASLGKLNCDRKYYVVRPPELLPITIPLDAPLASASTPSLRELSR